MVILEIFEGELVPISLDLDHLKSLKRTNFVPPLNSYKKSRLFDLVAFSYQFLSIIYAKPILALLEKKIANLAKSGNV